MIEDLRIEFPGGTDLACWVHEGTIFLHLCDLESITVGLTEEQALKLAAYILNNGSTWEEL